MTGKNSSDISSTQNRDGTGTFPHIFGHTNFTWPSPLSHQCKAACLFWYICRWLFWCLTWTAPTLLQSPLHSLPFNRQYFPPPWCPWRFFPIIIDIVEEVRPGGLQLIHRSDTSRMVSVNCRHDYIPTNTSCQSTQGNPVHNQPHTKLHQHEEWHMLRGGGHSMVLELPSACGIFI